MRPPVLVIEHADDCRPGRVGEWLAAAGWPLAVRRAQHGDAVPDSAADLAGLVVLGGPMGAYDDAVHPWLTATKTLLRDAVTRGVPTLGICLGHQLLAVATGGRVEPNPAGRQVGLAPLELTAAGRADPLLGGFRGAPAVHWNCDLVVEPPPGAAVLARSSTGIQALRIGSAVGVQFHPEVSPATVRRWAERYVGGGQVARTDADRQLAAIAAADDELQHTWRAFTVAFAASLAPSPAPSLAPT